jgi:hypothetical protein
MLIISLRLLRVTMVALFGLRLAGCGELERSASYRYKLTVAVNTPDGVRRGSNVTEWDFWEVSIPERGIPHRLRGEALYLDLGPGARPLIALLTSHLHEKPHHGVIWDWSGGELLFRLYGLRSTNFLDDVARLARMRGPQKITPADLPDLVTFADVNDPNTVIEVDRNDLQATLGPDISWSEITLESTDEPITKGIVQKLPWIPAYYHGMLDGARYKTGRTLANSLSTADFDQSGDLKGSK